MQGNWLHIGLNASFAILLLSFLLTLVRLIKGPTVQDRIVALDLTGSIVVAKVLIFALLTKQSVYVDIAIVIALVVFIGTVAISAYLKQKFNSHG
ncbi:MAG: monovalent cation/H+ antiporter complex subunit F [Bacteroidales bacterium]|nr:monovalent cation/H+ antiporter complex subunit F [Bacteroidales bacterium]